MPHPLDGEHFASRVYSGANVVINVIVLACSAPLWHKMAWAEVAVKNLLK